MSVALTGGVYGGVPLEGVKGLGTRVATSRLRTSLFEILRPRLEGARVLDLFAGIGTFGLEALSRGAAAATFLEIDPECLRAIEQNLRKFKCEQGEVIRANALTAATRLKGRVFDLVLVDPPYDYYQKRRKALLTALVTLGQSGIISDQGWVVVKHPTRSGFEEVEGFRQIDRRSYGDTELTFYLTCRAAS